MKDINKASAAIFTIGALIIVLSFASFHFSALTNDLDMMDFGPSQEGPTLLTIFTTFKEIRTIAHHTFSQGVVLVNWPLFKPFVRPVLFLNFTQSSIAKHARASGWEVLQLNRTNSEGTPHLKDMYMTVFDRYDSLFYGFSNGDLLFDDGLIKTLKAARNGVEVLDNNVMLTGRRTNVVVNLTDPRWNRDAFRVEKLQKLSIQNGSLIGPHAIDYFFFTKEGCSLNWSSLVDVVIGRPAYDSYLVGMARQQGVNVIDCTSTILAVHISQEGIPSTGKENADSQFNIRLIAPNFSHRIGYPTIAKLKTTKDVVGNVLITRRR